MLPLPPAQLTNLNAVPGGHVAPLQVVVQELVVQCEPPTPPSLEMIPLFVQDSLLEDFWELVRRDVSGGYHR